MSFDSLLIDLCDIERNTPGLLNEYGYPAPSWGPHISNERCRLTASTGREIKAGAEVVVADYKLFLSDVDVTEQDRIVVDGITYEILLVQEYADHTADHHKQLWMRASR